MDPTLLKEREAFLRRAKNAPVIEKPRTVGNTSTKPTDTAPLPKRTNILSDIDFTEFRVQSSGKFGLLASVVKYMKRRHLEGDKYPLAVEEILDEMRLVDRTPKNLVTWLENEALPNNPKILCTPEKKFAFKPKYKISNRTDLYKILRDHELRGLGGIYLDDVCECVADGEKLVDSLGDSVVRIVTAHDKKTVLFFNDKNYDLHIDEEFKQIWRGVSVEGMTEGKIEEYLHRNGIMTMSADKKVILPVPTKTKRRGVRRINRPVKLKDNEHVKDLLQDFSELKRN